MKIKIKYHLGATRIEQNGDWIDAFPRFPRMFMAPTVIKDHNNNNFIKFDFRLIDLGFSMALPKHIEAHVVPRSSTYLKQGLMQANHMGVIDHLYSGEEDIWKFPAVAFRATRIGEAVDTEDKFKAICQFRLQPTMNAPWWVKLRWLFVSKIKFIEVDVLNGANRGGFGTTD